jgi:uncharacterized protein
LFDISIQLRDKHPDAFYLNFEDTRLYGFEPSDFVRLDSLVTEMAHTVLFFGEIQIVDRWETYVRQKLDEGCKIVITGSNASLLSRELGTKLTGRQITKELFSFSYSEFCTYRGPRLLPIQPAIIWQPAAFPNA